MGVLDLYPRKAQGLPPGQREIKTFPRFSDQPLRWAPKPSPLALEISVEGEPVATIGPDDWDQFERVEQTNDFHCVTTWSYRGLRWAGYSFAEVIRETVGADLLAYMVAIAGDTRQATFLTEDAIASDVLLATHLDEQPLTAKHGAPLRLVSPQQYGYKSAKHLIGIDFRSEEPESTLGAKEHLRARVAKEERHSSLPNWILRRPYRLTVAPTAMAAERGLRNSPT